MYNTVNTKWLPLLCSPGSSIIYWRLHNVRVFVTTVKVALNSLTHQTKRASFLFEVEDCLLIVLDTEWDWISPYDFVMFFVFISNIFSILASGWSPKMWQKHWQSNHSKVVNVMFVLLKDLLFIIFFAPFCPLLICFIQRNPFFGCHLAVCLALSFCSVFQTNKARNISLGCV